MKLYAKFFSLHLRSMMQYKSSFFLMTLGQFILAFSAFLSVWFLFDRFHQVDGFTFEQVLLCFSVTLMAFSWCEGFFRGFDTFSSTIQNAEFDRILLRPRNEIFLVLSGKIELSKIGRLLQAFLVFLYALPVSGVEWNVQRVLVLLFMLIGGVCVFCGLFLIYAAICFFTVEGLEFMNIFTDGGKEFGSYPMSIYGDGILRFFTFMVPIACFQYWPLLYLLGKSDSLWCMLSPLVCIVFLLPCWGFWRFGVRHYQSTGS
ncbi:MAG TPA: ABC-2 family transporter protein [Candidatus Gallacutalibacter pullistercoris]|nr:ABC-2 family transporter protein [Candidatus Gallacutalibacter pullistercoris]